MIFLKRVQNIFRRRNYRTSAAVIQCDAHTSLYTEIEKKKKELLDLIKFLNTL
jgi:c-di-GMP-binding flagellar brake protein YcgR